MGTVRTLIAEKKQQILQLYLCSNDRRLKCISDITNSSDGSVSKIIQEYFDGTIEFETDYFVYHSSLNNINYDTKREVV